jgi:glycogen(starch) synthase
MRICLVSQEYPPETAHGGIATQTHAKAHGLAARGHEVCVLSHAVGGGRSETHDGAVRVVRVPGADDGLTLHTEAARWVTWSARVAEALAALHTEAPLELIDFAEFGGEGFVHLLNRAPWARVPTTVHLQGPSVMLAHTIGWPEPGSDLYHTALHMEGTCVRLADAVYSSSRCSAEWCAEHHGLDPARVPVLHTGVDVRAFRPPVERPAGAPTVLFVGRVAASKGALDLLDAAARVAARRPGLTLRLVGAGEASVLSEVAARARKAPGLSVESVGHVARARLTAEYARADLFAAPSRWEGGPGFVYLEAMASGLPVIACSGSGAAEVVTDGETGLLVAPGDVDALVAALERMLTDADERRMMGRRAHEYALREADSERCLDRIERFLVETTRAVERDRA